MNYKNIYERLMEKARIRGKILGYKERHHIIPKCMGGRQSEIVDLLLREHFIAHMLLTKIFPKHKGLKQACVRIQESKKNEPIKNSRIYQTIRSEWIQSISGEKSIFYGKHSSNLGKHHTEEAKKRMSIAKKGKYIEKNNPFFGKKHSEETKRKMSQDRKGNFGYMLGKHHTEETKRKLVKKTKKNILVLNLNLKKVVYYLKEGNIVKKQKKKIE